jgi:hypothetical protein
VNFALECLTIRVQLSGIGTTGLIYAQDLYMGKIHTGVFTVKDLTIANVGKIPFTLTTWTMTGLNAFTFTTSPALPFTLKPGNVQPVTVTVQYAPTIAGKDTAIIHWNTDIDAPFTQSIKSYSVLTGEGTGGSTSVEILSRDPIFFIHPNPANGNSIVLSFSEDQKVNAEVAIYDVLGREVYKRNIFGEHSIEIPIQGLSNGIYHARVSSGGEILTEKFEVRR